MKISGFGESDTGAWDALHRGTDRESFDSPSHYELSTLKTMLPHRRPSTPPPPAAPQEAPESDEWAGASDYYDDEGRTWQDDGESGHWAEDAGPAAQETGYYGADYYDAEPSGQAAPAGYRSAAYDTGYERSPYDSGHRQTAAETDYHSAPLDSAYRPAPAYEPYTAEPEPGRYAQHRLAEPEYAEPEYAEPGRSEAAAAHDWSETEAADYDWQQPEPARRSTHAADDRQSRGGRHSYAADEPEWQSEPDPVQPEYLAAQQDWAPEPTGRTSHAAEQDWAREPAYAPAAEPLFEPTVEPTVEPAVQPAVDAPAKPARSRVRPYARTGGRTRSDHNLALEALVSTSDDGRRYRGVRSIEHRRICDLCLDTRSVAEIAAHLRLPLGVVKVLVGDMADLGLVLIHQTELILGDRSSREFMERVLQGLRAL
ncbi:DUF742 domain-containing protein [Amycolatopsis saalfeldensis]|uniref:DUF742 domain-containing protein n=1 Tax=Amycolatopsis saalfeldensis TaxID=394193 RepID=A0A1H8WIN0_9PSEU|nr:Protein of unknown function [Amycolatopsis saalfeldensis]